MTRSVSLSTYPNCCGIYILNDFFKGHDIFLSLEDCWKKLDIKPYKISMPTEEFLAARNTEYQTENLPEYLERIRRQVSKFTKDYRGKKSYFLATISHKEYESLGDLLEELGFEILIPWTRNPTGTKIQTYIYHLLDKETGPKESILKRQDQT